MSRPEFWFYHLERQPAQAVLPALLEKTLARGWRALIRTDSKERLEAIDAALWTYRDDSFLPHELEQDRHAERQPILLSLSGAPVNGAQLLILLDGAEENAPERYERVVRLFNGADEDEKAKARAEWSAAKAKGADVSYWRQEADGRWVKAG
jgi:DNA polymerase-3 subunit chi